jgi:hypothetical protein
MLLISSPEPGGTQPSHDSGAGRSTSRHSKSIWLLTDSAPYPLSHSLSNEVAARYFNEDDFGQPRRSFDAGAADDEGQSTFLVGAMDDPDPTTWERDGAPWLEQKANAELIFVAAMAEKTMQAFHQLEGSWIVMVAEKGVEFMGPK